MRLRTLLVVLGPMLGLIGLGHLADGRPGRALLLAGAGWLLLLDVARSVQTAADGGPTTVAALGAALSTWVYLLLAGTTAWRTWDPSPPVSGAVQTAPVLAQGQ